MKREWEKKRWDKNDEQCLKCLPLERYQKGQIPLCVIEKACVQSEEFKRWMKEQDEML